jgi:predicted TIM-barrel fold metal-dependent hydrolase
MSEPQTVERALPYLINDADEHSTPNFSAYERYIDPDKKDMAIRIERGDAGRATVTYNGRPARFTFKNFQVVGSNEQLAEVGVKDLGASDDMGGQVIPGSLLTRLNPLKELDAEGRKEFARRYRELQPQLDNPADRLTVMDAQGIQCAVNYAAIPGMEVEFEDDFDGLYANLVALNRYLGTEWGYNYERRLYTPPFISFADPDAALMLLEEIMKIEVPKVIQTSTGPSMHTSPFRPENDRFWSVCSEAGIKLCTHLATVTRYGAQGLEWNEEEVMLGDMDAFQYAFFYGDRPAMETVGAAILQGLFNRFPNVKLLISEQGSLWVPYLVKIMDNTFFMGRKATWGALERRPSEYFKEHVLVAPWPEENVGRVTSVVGTDPIVFGSDFPHGNGLPDPAMYLPQLEGCTNDQARAIMRGNLGRFLGLQD